jgi:hypothetical protein
MKRAIFIALLFGASATLFAATQTVQQAPQKSTSLQFGELNESFNESDFPPAGWERTTSAVTTNNQWLSTAQHASQYATSGMTVLLQTAEAMLQVGDGKHAAYSGLDAAGSWARLESPYIVPQAGNRTIMSFDLWEIIPTPSWIETGMLLYIDIYNNGSWVQGTENIMLQVPNYNTASGYAAVHNTSINVNMSAYIGDTIKVGFRAIGDYSGTILLIDNVDFRGLSLSSAVFEGDSLVDLGDGKDLYGYFGATYQIRNRGTDTLEVSLKAPVERISIDGLPARVPPGEYKSITINLAAQGLNGAVDIPIVFATNEGPDSEVVVTAHADVIAVSVCKYLNENFDAHEYLPDGWSEFSHNNEILAGKGVNGTNANVGIIYNSDFTFSSDLVTPLVAVVNGAQLSVTYKVVHPSNGLPIDESIYYLDVYVASLNSLRAYYANPESGLTGIWLTNIPYNGTSDFQTLTMPLDDLVGDTFIFNISAEITTEDTYAEVVLDNIKIGTSSEHDLQLAEFSDASFGVVGTPMNIKVRVANIGTVSVPAGYTVKLVNGSTVYASVSGVALNPDESIVYTLPYTPDIAGVKPAQIQVAYSSDNDQSNNNSTPFTMKIFEAGTTLLEAVGDPEKKIQSTSTPMYLWYRNSVTQTLYTPAEIGSNVATINGIAYEFSFNEVVGALPVAIWIGTTDKSDLSDERWFDTTEMTKVFSGVNVPDSRHNNRMYIPFDNPYNYNGGNLIVYVVRQDANSYSLTETFMNSSAPARTLLFYHHLTLSLDTAVLKESTEIMNVYSNAVFVSTITGAGALSGVVYGANAAPLAGALVEVMGEEMKIVTDENGAYRFPHIAGKTYSIKVTAYHYEDTVCENFSVSANSENTLNVYLTEEDNYALSYTISTAYNPTPISGVSVKLHGKDVYQGVTDAEGKIVFNKVYSGTYEQSIIKDGYKPVYENISVTLDNESIISLDELYYASGAVTAVAGSDSNVTVTWGAAGAPTTFRYDNGVLTGTLGSWSGTRYGVMGNAFPKQAELVSASWYTVGATHLRGPHEFVNLFIFALDEIGKPTNSVLFSQTEIPNTDDSWTTFYLPEPIYAQNGFMLALSYDYGYAGIGTATPDDTYPFVADQYYCSNYISDTFHPIEKAGFTTNFMIRANGTDLSGAGLSGTDLGGTDLSGTPTLTDYKLYRLVKGSSLDTWTSLTRTDNLSYIDDKFKEQAGGTYQYAVVATYRSGAEDANAALSNELSKGDVANNEALHSEAVVKLYPNPTNGALYVRTAEKAQVEVFDLFGRKYVSQTVATEATLNVSDCPAGALFVKIITDNGTAVHKIMKIN